MPTKPRIRALLLNQGLLSPHYPVKAIIALGIALTVCGVTLTIFGGVAALIDSSTTAANICSGFWVGVLVTFSGLIAVFAGNRPYSGFCMHMNLFVAIVTLAITGFMTILTANSVVKEGDHNALESLHITEAGETLDMNLNSQTARSPAFMVNSLLLVTSSLSSVLSFANFCLTGREACQCYGPLDVCRPSAGLHRLSDPLSGTLGMDTVQRRDRIITWILQQTSEAEVSECPSPDLERGSPQHHAKESALPASTLTSVAVSTTTSVGKEKLKPINSNASTASTRLSAYEV